MVDGDLTAAEKKLMFADFLLNREDTQPYDTAAIRHVLEAAKLSIRALTDLSMDDTGSPQLVKQTLARFEEKEPQDFARGYMDFLSAVSKGTAKKLEIQNTMHKIRDFIQWIESR